MPELESIEETERNCPRCLGGKLLAVVESWQDDDSRIEITESDWCRECGYDFVKRDDGNRGDVPYERVVLERSYRNLPEVLRAKNCIVLV